MLPAVDPGFALEARGDGQVLRLTGDWTVASLHAVEEAFGAAPLPAGTAIDVSALGRLDTAGAFVIARRFADWPPQLIGAQ
jgi:phospholipid/cholesterol/gamma-HCH transport system permease protein